MPTLPAAAPPSAPARPSNAAPLGVFAVLTLAFGAAGAIAHRVAEAEFRASRAAELGAVVALKVEQVVQWREERLADAATLARDPVLVAALVDPRGRRASLGRAELESWFEGLRGFGECVSVALVDPSGVPLARAGPVDHDPQAVRALVARSAAGGRPVMSGVRDEQEGGPHLDVVAAVHEGGRLAGAVLLGVDPRPHLFRLVEFWHEPSGSAEVLLVGTAQGAPSVLNGSPRAARDESRFPLGAAVERGVAHRAPAVFQDVDALGAAVIGAAAPVPGTPWSVVVKEDARDTLAPLRERAVAIAVAVLALVVAAAAGVAYWTSAQARRFERARAIADSERAALARRLERLTTYATDMVLVADAEQRIVEANDRAVSLLGYPREELLGLPVRALRDPATLADYDERVRHQTAAGTALFETRYRRKDGTTFPVQVSVHSEVYEGRRYFEAVAHDLSDVSRAEEALRASEAKLRAVFEHASLGVVLADAHGRVLETNRAFRELTGHSEDEVRGAATVTLHDPEDEVASDLVYRRLSRGDDRVEVARRLRRKDGSWVETVVRASALRDASGAPQLVIALVEDVSEKKRLEAQLVLADRMASVGTLAAGVAHEINNPLAFILSNVEFAIAETGRAGGDPEILRALADARDGAARVREIVRDLKAFSRPADERRQPLVLAPVLRSALGLAANEIRHRAQLVVALGDAPPVVADEHRLGQVFLNLLINAAQAIPEGNVAGNLVRVATATAPDGAALVEIQDSGGGIPPEVLPRIFDPFFTTKPVGVGTGLGLSICHGIVAQLGGAIEVESAQGKGSTFRVRLPAAGSGACAAPTTPRPTDGAGARRGRVLVVDDEPLVGRAVARSLASHHDVVTLTGAREALDRVSRGEDGFELLLCDLMMPEMTGMELHERLREVAPALAARTIFLSGGAFTAAAREFLERVPNARLEKPFEPRALRELVARVLEGTEAPPRGG
jgi:PAS domain S-box-containing protein